MPLRCSSPEHLYRDQTITDHKGDQYQVHQSDA